MQSVFLFITILITPFAFSQSWEWSASAGASKSDKGIDMDTDAEGNVFVCGYYNTTNNGGANFGPLGTSATGFGKEGFVARIDADGNWQWVKIAQGGWDERVLGMCVDKINNWVYVTGTCWNQTDFGSCTATYPGSSDNIFVGKFDLSGNCQWLVGAGGGSDDHGFDLVTDKDGNIYLTGLISNEYNPGQVMNCTFSNLNIPVPLGEDSLAFVAKMDPNGTFKWVKTFKATDGERDNRIAIDDSANIYVCGGFWGSGVNFDGSTVSTKGGMDIFVVKYDSAGNRKWVKTTGGILDDRANSITVDKYNQIYVTGEFRDNVSFDGDTVNNHGGPNGRDIFVAKMTTNGNWIWAKRAGSDQGSERGNRIISNKQGDIYFTGEYQDTAKFGTQITLISTPGNLEVFVACMDTGGTWKWVLSGGSPGEDRGNGLAIDEQCNLYNCGYYDSTANFGSNNISAQGLKDIYVSKIMRACRLLPYEISGVVIVPTAFTPNGDGNNDLLYPYGTADVSKLEFEIFNRWGEKIFATNDKTKGWDGTFQGNLVEMGVYAYRLKVVIGGKTSETAGNVTLIR